MLSQWWNHFLVCTASDEMRSAYAQPAMKFVPGMFSIFWIMFLKWEVISPYAEHARKLVTCRLSMHGNWLLIGWACAEIGYSLAEHTRKLVTRWLSICGKFVFIGSEPCFSPVICSPVPFSRPLSNILCLVSQVSVLCLPSSVSCLTSLFLVSRPLFPVSRLCPCLQSSVPCLTSLFPVSRPLSPILCSMSHFFVPCLPSSVPCLTSLFLVSRPLFHVSRLCSLSPILCSMSHFFVPCLPSSVPCLTSLFLVSRPLFSILRLCSLSPILFPQT
jgi:hypothetical protein